MRVVIVSAADQGFWPLLSGLLNSINEGRRSANYAIGILDLGLSDSQHKELEAYGARVVTPGWDCDLALFDKEPPAYFRAMTARPHLPSYFPGFDLIVWLDADCWVQDWRAVEMLALAAKDFGFAVIPEVDRSYISFMNNGTPYVDFFHSCLEKCYGSEFAQKYKYYDVLNCGVFAARRDTALWEHWSSYLSAAFRRLREPFFFAEQTAMNACVRAHAIPSAFLPARFNWMASRALPRLSFDGKIYLEKHPPFEHIGILHLAAETRDRSWDIYDLGGNKHHRYLNFPPL